MIIRYPICHMTIFLRIINISLYNPAIVNVEFIFFRYNTTGGEKNVPRAGNR